MSAVPYLKRLVEDNYEVREDANMAFECMAIATEIEKIEKAGGFLEKWESNSVCH